MVKDNKQASRRKFIQQSALAGAGVTLFLCSNAASYLTGQAIPVDGEYTVH